MSNESKDLTNIGPAIEADDVVIQGNFGDSSTKGEELSEAKQMLYALSRHQTLGRTGHAEDEPVTYNNRSPALSLKGGK